MKSIKIGEKWIGGNNPCFIIAEIGQNHQGNIDIAKEMIFSAKNMGADCVKFQKSCLSDKFTASALDRPYISCNSFGKNYGSHKRFLEFSEDEFRYLQRYSQKMGIIFSASAHDQTSFNQLIDLKCPFIKIGSGDANNFPLLRMAITQNVPLIISTGMQEHSTILKINEIMEQSQFKDFCLMHCVSSYPTMPEDTNLRFIENFSQLFPNIIGYSGHEQGIEICQAAVLLGAKIVERHFTLDKSLKGSDHKSSLLPNEFAELIKKIRAIENVEMKSSETINILEILKLHNNLNQKSITEDLKQALKKTETRKLLECEEACYKKLGKSLVYSKNLKKGDSLAGEDILVKVSEPKGLRPEMYDEIVGKILQKNVFADFPILNEDLKLN